MTGNVEDTAHMTQEKVVAKKRTGSGKTRGGSEKSADSRLPILPTMFLNGKYMRVYGNVRETRHGLHVPLAHGFGCRQAADYTRLRTSLLIFLSYSLHL
jgi:hypothetical protein